jgi:hypothetical protein
MGDSRSIRRSSLAPSNASCSMSLLTSMIFMMLACVMIASHLSSGEKFTILPEISRVVSIFCTDSTSLLARSSAVSLNNLNSAAVTTANSSPEESIEA